MTTLPPGLKAIYKSTKNTVLQVPEIERKVKESTSNEKWGPTSTQMREIAQATYSYHDLPLIMNAIWRRLNDHGKYWRHVYKSLLLIDYLLRNGSEQVVRECRDHIVAIQTLSEFQYIDEKEQDVGLSVRERARQIVELVHDEKRLKSEREKAKNTQKKFLVGMGSQQNPGYYDGSGGNDHESYEREDNGSREMSEVDEETNRNEYREETRARPRAPSGSERLERPETMQRSSSTSSFQKPETVQRSSSTPSYQKPQQTQVANLFDIDEVVSAPNPTKAQEFEFFNTPGAFGNVSQPPAQSPFQRPQNNDFFDPRGNSGNSFSAAPSNEWADFQGVDNSNGNQHQEQQNQEQQNQDGNGNNKPSEYDPWNQKHLFDLGGLNSKDQQNSGKQITYSPMGAMPGGKTPIGSGTGARPMGGSISTPMTGMNTGMGMNPNMGMGMNPNMGMGMNPNMGMGMNPNMGMNTGMGMNTNMGMNTGMGMNPNMGMGMNPNMGMNTGMGMNPNIRPMGTPMATGFGNTPNTPSMGRGTPNNVNWNPF